MQELKVAAMMGIGVLAIDYGIRVAIRSSRDARHYKSAGILSLLVFSMGKGAYQLGEKLSVIKQLVLSMVIVIFLLMANYFLLQFGMPKQANVLHFILMLAPLLVMPFYHFLHDLLIIRPLSIEGVVSVFQERSTLSLILSANIIFISIEHQQNIPSLFFHFLMAFLALIGSFYLCTTHRRLASSFDFSTADFVDYLPPATFHYLASILEFLYLLVIIYFFFVEGPKEAFFTGFFGLLPICIFAGILLVLIAIAVKFRIHHNAPLSPAFYQDRVLPASFFLYAVVTVFFEMSD